MLLKVTGKLRTCFKDAAALPSRKININNE
jgi:hypothetical protein